ncbi:MAG: hypothetical protein QXV57_07625 [Thermoproteota archaeon]
MRLDSIRDLRNAFKISSKVLRQAFSILAFPDMPTIIDLIFWKTGKVYCNENNPRCSEFPLNKLFDYVRKKAQAYST